MSDNPVNKLPDWIKRSGWIRENSEVHDENKPVNPTSPEPITDTPSEEGINPPDQVFQSSDASGAIPDDTGTTQLTSDSQNLEDHPSEEPGNILADEIVSVVADHMDEESHDVSSTDTDTTSDESMVSPPEISGSDVELVQSGNFLADLPTIPEDEENSGEYEELPDWLKNYEPESPQTGNLIASVNKDLNVPDSSEPVPNIEEVSENSTLQIETPKLLQSKESESLEADETDTPSVEFDQQLPSADPLITKFSEDSEVHHLIEEDHPVIVPPPLPSSQQHAPSNHDEQILQDAEVGPLPFSSEAEFKEETVTVEEIEEPPVETHFSETEGLIQPPELSAIGPTTPELLPENLSHPSEETTDSSASFLGANSQSDTEETELLSPELIQESPLDPIHEEKQPVLIEPLDTTIEEILTKVNAHDYSNLDNLLEDYHSHSDSYAPLLIRLEEVSDEQTDSYEYWQLLADLLNKSGNHEEALDALRLSEKILRK